MSEAKPSAPSDVRAYMVAYYSIAVVEAIYISVLSGLLDVSKAMDQLIRVCSSMGEMSREATEAIISSPISKSAVDLLAHLLSSSILLLDRSAVVKSLQIDKKEETVEYRGLGAYAWEKVTLRFCSLYGLHDEPETKTSPFKTLIGLWTQTNVGLCAFEPSAADESERVLCSFFSHLMAACDVKIVPRVPLIPLNTYWASVIRFIKLIVAEASTRTTIISNPSSSDSSPSLPSTSTLSPSFLARVSRVVSFIVDQISLLSFSTTPEVEQLEKFISELAHLREVAPQLFDPSGDMYTTSPPSSAQSWRRFAVVKAKCKSATSKLGAAELVLGSDISVSHFHPHPMTEDIMSMVDSPSVRILSYDNRVHEGENTKPFSYCPTFETVLPGGRFSVHVNIPFEKQPFAEKLVMNSSMSMENVSDGKASKCMYSQIALPYPFACGSVVFGSPFTSKATVTVVLLQRRRRGAKESTNMWSSAIPSTTGFSSFTSSGSDWIKVAESPDRNSHNLKLKPNENLTVSFTVNAMSGCVSWLFNSHPVDRTLLSSDVDEQSPLYLGVSSASFVGVNIIDAYQDFILQHQEVYSTSSTTKSNVDSDSVVNDGGCEKQGSDSTQTELKDLQWLVTSFPHLKHVPAGLEEEKDANLGVSSDLLPVRVSSLFRTVVEDFDGVGAIGFVDERKVEADGEKEEDDIPKAERERKKTIKEGMEHLVPFMEDLSLRSALSESKITSIPSSLKLIIEDSSMKHTPSGRVFSALKEESKLVAPWKCKVSGAGIEIPAIASIPTATSATTTVDMAPVITETTESQPENSKDEKTVFKDEASSDDTGDLVANVEEKKLEESEGESKKEGDNDGEDKSKRATPATEVEQEKKTDSVNLSRPSLRSKREPQSFEVMLLNANGDECRLPEGSENDYHLGITFHRSEHAEIDWSQPGFFTTPHINVCSITNTMFPSAVYDSRLKRVIVGEFRFANAPPSNVSTSPLSLLDPVSGNITKVNNGARVCALSLVVGVSRNIYAVDSTRIGTLGVDPTGASTSITHSVNHELGRGCGVAVDREGHIHLVGGAYGLRKHYSYRERALPSGELELEEVDTEELPFDCVKTQIVFDGRNNMYIFGKENVFVRFSGDGSARPELQAREVELESGWRRCPLPIDGPSAHFSVTQLNSTSAVACDGDKLLLMALPSLKTKTLAKIPVDYERYRLSPLVIDDRIFLFGGGSPLVYHAVGSVMNSKSLPVVDTVLSEDRSRFIVTYKSADTGSYFVDISINGHRVLGAPFGVQVCDEHDNPEGWKRFEGAKLALQRLLDAQQRLAEEHQTPKKGRNPNGDGLRSPATPASPAFLVPTESLASLQSRLMVIESALPEMSHVQTLQQRYSTCTMAKVKRRLAKTLMEYQAKFQEAAEVRAKIAAFGEELEEEKKAADEGRVRGHRGSDVENEPKRFPDEDSKLHEEKVEEPSDPTSPSSSSHHGGIGAETSSDMHTLRSVFEGRLPQTLVSYKPPDFSTLVDSLLPVIFTTVTYLAGTFPCLVSLVKKIAHDSSDAAKNEKIHVPAILVQAWTDSWKTLRSTVGGWTDQNEPKKVEKSTLLQNLHDFASIRNSFENRQHRKGVSTVLYNCSMALRAFNAGEALSPSQINATEAESRSQGSVRLGRTYKEILKVCCHSRKLDLAVVRKYAELLRGNDFVQVALKQMPLLWAMTPNSLRERAQLCSLLISALPVFDGEGEIPSYLYFRSDSCVAQLQVCLVLFRVDALNVWETLKDTAADAVHHLDIFVDQCEYLVALMRLLDVRNVRGEKLLPKEDEELVTRAKQEMIKYIPAPKPLALASSALSPTLLGPLSEPVPLIGGGAVYEYDCPDSLASATHVNVLCSVKSPASCRFKVEILALDNGGNDSAISSSSSEWTCVEDTTWEEYLMNNRDLLPHSGLISSSYRKQYAVVCLNGGKPTRFHKLRLSFYDLHSVRIEQLIFFFSPYYFVVSVNVCWFLFFIFVSSSP